MQVEKSEFVQSMKGAFSKLATSIQSKASAISSRTGELVDAQVEKEKH